MLPIPSLPAAVLRRSTLCALLAAGLFGCASPPVRYYTLVAPAEAPDAPASRPPARADYDFVLLPIKVPAQNDQAPLVLRTGTGQVAVLDNERWAAPLGDELRTAFSAALERQLGATDVTSVAKGGVRRVVQIAIDVQRFELDPGRAATLGVTWSARAPGAAGGGGGSGVVVACSMTRATPVAGPGYPALVESQQKSMLAVTRQMATVLGTWDGRTAVACPEAAAPAG